jgi:ankyrin repeat protein
MKKTILLLMFCCSVPLGAGNQSSRHNNLQEVNTKPLSEQLFKAVKTNDYESIKNLLEKVDKLELELEIKDDDGYTALYLAAWHGYTPIVKLLLDAGAKYDAIDSREATVCHMLANKDIESEEHSATLRLLINAGADFDAKDMYHYTALHYVARHGHVNLAQLLIDAGASLDAPDPKGYVALHYAIQYQHSALVELLVKAGADLNSVAEYDYTPLHYAAWFKDIDSTMFLLRGGANPFCKNNHKKKPSEIYLNTETSSALCTMEDELKRFSLRKQSNESVFRYPKETYLKAMRHQAANKLQVGDSTYCIDLLTVYKYYIENQRFNALDTLLKKTAFTAQDRKKLGGLLAGSQEATLQQKLLNSSNQRDFLDVRIYCKNNEK